MNEKEHILVTAALPYANGPLHIGHIAGCYLPSDIYVRYLRLQGKEVAYICGSDEHGVPITIRAQKEGVTPQQVVDKYHGIMQKAFEDFGISFDIYSRTSSANHHKTSQEIFLDLYNQGKFTEETTEQYFDEQANQFLADRYIVGTCPNCQNPGAYGDQCEKCGKSLSPSDLINPHSALSGNKPVLKKTKNWYLPLDKFQPMIAKYIDGHKEDWKPNVYGQCKSWIDQGLQPRAMTRDLDWGVKVPLPDAEGKVMYVWFDAPIGYISFTKERYPEKWEKFWKDENAKIIHFIGKDNIVFHCIIFPAMLMNAGYQYAKNVPANEFLNLEGDKISTSRNHAVWLHEYLHDFPGKTDELRYVLTSIAPETKDSDFTWKDYQQRVNSELVAIFGNFVNRVMVLSHKFYNGKVTNADITALSPALKTIVDGAMAGIDENAKKVSTLLGEFKFREAQFEMMNVARIGNKLLADTEPWKLVKTNPAETEIIMGLGVQITALLAALCEPFIPVTSVNILKQLNMDAKHLDSFWKNPGYTVLVNAGHQLGEAALLFKNIEDAEINVQLEKLAAAKKLNEAAAQTLAPAKEAMTYDDFTKLDLRVGTILEAQKVKGADKLLQLKVDTGLDQRTVVSGIAEHYKPEDIIGQKVTILANLAPRKIRGVESHGMILMAEDKTGKLCFVQPSDAGFENGSVVR